MGITKDGIEGEQKLFKFLRENNFDFFQPDGIGIKDGKYYMFEVKHQERFRPPPFEGHGLPKWQVEARLRFQKATGVPCILIIFDKETSEIFSQRLDKLEKGEFIDTNGQNPRRIYNLKEFKIYVNSQNNGGEK